MSRVKLLLIMLLLGAGLGYNPVCAQSVGIDLENPAMSFAEKSYMSVNPLDMVASPNRYLNKNVKVRAKFDKFSTLGLDYSPALRSSDDYITFLIQRDDVRDHNIPLSEMKIFMKRTEAEKHIDLNSGDGIEFCGKVFSTALGDIWMDVDKFNVLSVKEPKKTTSPETKK